jgi:coenzyme F420-reducing hydrogenase beta subunit
MPYEHVKDSMLPCAAFLNKLECPKESPCETCESATCVSNCPRCIELKTAADIKAAQKKFITGECPNGGSSICMSVCMSVSAWEDGFVPYEEQPHE